MPRYKPFNINDIINTYLTLQKARQVREANEQARRINEQRLILNALKMQQALNPPEQPTIPINIEGKTYPMPYSEAWRYLNRRPDTSISSQNWINRQIEQGYTPFNPNVITPVNPANPFTPTPYITNPYNPNVGFTVPPKTPRLTATQEKIKRRNEFTNDLREAEKRIKKGLLDKQRAYEILSTAYPEYDRFLRGRYLGESVSLGKMSLEELLGTVGKLFGKK